MFPWRKQSRPGQTSAPQAISRRALHLRKSAWFGSGPANILAQTVRQAMLITALLSTIAGAVLVQQIVAFRRLVRYVEGELERESVAYTPRVAVILPCKGLDPGFRENVLRLVHQDYAVGGKPNFEIIFAVAQADDPAYPVLSEIAGSGSPVPMQVVVAGKSTVRAQKINNQLAALALASPEAEVFVFVDSDVIATSDFLRHLVSRLEDEGVGATTGYRFYIPYAGGWASLVRSLWNRMSAWELANPEYAFAWGGAMAIRRETFENARVSQAWQRSADDDLALTTCVKNAGLSVRFVPQCLVASHGDGTPAEIIEWTNRQLILTKVYYPKLWRRAIFRAAIMAVWLLSVFAAGLGVALGGGQAWALSLAAGLAIIPIELSFLYRAQSMWARVLAERAGELDQSFWRFVMAVPLAHLTLPWLTLYSLTTNRIQWRGVTYELRSPTETVVI